MRALHCAALLGLGLVVGACRPSADRDADSGAAAPSSDTTRSSVYDTTASGAITTTRVAMNVRCDADDVEFGLHPWRAKASPGSTVRFSITSTVGAEIVAKDPAKWPFDRASPLPVTSGAPVDYTIRKDADTTAYSYAVRFDCGTAGGPVTIDPDIIIVDAM